MESNETIFYPQHLAVPQYIEGGTRRQNTEGSSQLKNVPNSIFWILSSVASTSLAPMQHFQHMSATTIVNSQFDGSGSITHLATPIFSSPFSSLQRTIGRLFASKNRQHDICRVTYVLITGKIITEV